MGPGPGPNMAQYTTQRRRPSAAPLRDFLYMVAGEVASIAQTYRRISSALDMYIGAYISHIPLEALVQACLRSRLGYVAMFPFIQPEQARFKLNLAHYEQRVGARDLYRHFYRGFIGTCIGLILGDFHVN